MSFQEVGLLVVGERVECIRAHDAQGSVVGVGSPALMRAIASTDAARAAMTV
jgi:hypothetical protein